LRRYGASIAVNPQGREGGRRRRRRRRRGFIGRLIAHPQSQIYYLTVFALQNKLLLQQPSMQHDMTSSLLPADQQHSYTANLCSQCGGGLQAGAKFCRGCGASA